MQTNAAHDSFTQYIIVLINWSNRDRDIDAG